MWRRRQSTWFVPVEDGVVGWVSGGEPIDGCPLTRWEQRSEDAVLCETVHRTKGLEKMAVILVDQSEEPNEVLLYVGASRAVASLTVVGSMAVGEALALVGD